MIRKRECVSVDSNVDYILRIPLMGFVACSRCTFPTFEIRVQTRCADCAVPVVYSVSFVGKDSTRQFHFKSIYSNARPLQEPNNAYKSKMRISRLSSNSFGTFSIAAECRIGVWNTIFDYFVFGKCFRRIEIRHRTATTID